MARVDNITIHISVDEASANKTVRQIDEIYDSFLRYLALRSLSDVVRTAAEFDRTMNELDALTKDDADG